MKTMFLSVITLMGCLFISFQSFSQVQVFNNTSCDMWVGGALGACGAQSGSVSGFVAANTSAFLSQSGSGNLITAEASLYNCSQVTGSYDDLCSGSQVGESLTCCPQWQITIAGPAVAEIN